MNGLLLAFADLLHNDQADAYAAEQAFDSTHGPFFERFTAAVNALLLPHLRPEKFIEIPENPERMTRSDLDTLVRPVAEGFLRSHPTKEELLSELRQIARRQASRPSWMPLTEDSVGVIDNDETSDESSRLVPMRLSGFPELGEITINAPAFYGDPMYSADSNQPALLQMALLTVFGAAVPDAAGRTVRGDGTALDALVPAENRWWVTSETNLTPGSTADDPGIAVEVLATTESLGSTPLQDIDGPNASTLAAGVLLSTGSWKHGPLIVVDELRPSDDSRLRSLARASFAGWADDTNQGFAIAVVSGGWDEEASVYPLGQRLHTYVLWWTAPQAGTTQDLGTLRRVILHCPGEEICRRGGCDTTLDDELLAAVGLVAVDAGVAASIAANADWAADAYRASWLGTVDDEPEEVLSIATQPLLAAGWEEIFSSSSELGDVEVLLSRRDQVLTAAYSPMTREITFADGRRELDFLCEILADEGDLIEDSEGIRQVNRTAVSDTWSDSALSLIEKHLRHDLADNTTLVNPINILAAGTWPWGTGVPSTDKDRSLVHSQVMLTLIPTPLLGE
jgi:hypothetical protein